MMQNHLYGMLAARKEKARAKSVIADTLWGVGWSYPSKPAQFYQTFKTPSPR
jgi:hypothetical protein